jgi:hypothetical protein
MAEPWEALARWGTSRATDSPAERAYRKVRDWPTRSATSRVTDSPTKDREMGWARR